MAADTPAVSVILAVLNEADHIDDVLTDLLNQDYEGPLEVIVADGGSTDGTTAKLATWAAGDSRVKVVSNPERRQGFGLNIAASASDGTVLIRADGHTRYAPDYVNESVAALQELGGAVGGRMNPVGETAFERAVASAMNSPLTMGPARFHHAIDREEVDTVYLGAFDKTDFQDIGGFRAFPSGSSEDADLYFRWRESDRKVFVIPTIRTRYVPRGELRSLWSQYWRYGLGKAEMFWVNGRFPSYRPFVPIGLVVGLMATLGIGFLGGIWVPALALLGVWLALLAFVGVSGAASAPLVMVAAAVMHLAYGLGGLIGLLRGPGPVRSLRP